MTIIAAVNIDRQIWVGSDTCSTYMESFHPSQSKWVISPDGKSAIGHAGDKLAEQVVRRESGVLAFGKSPGKMAMSLREVLDKSGFFRPVFDAGEATGCYKQSWIYAWQHGIAYIASDFSFVTGQRMAAKGSGERYALGAGFVADGTAHEILRKMLHAAISLDLYCGGRPWMKRIK